MVEQGTLNPKVRGSSPRRSTISKSSPRNGAFSLPLVAALEGNVGCGGWSNRGLSSASLSFSPSPSFEPFFPCARMGEGRRQASPPLRSSLPRSVYKNDDKLRRNCVLLPKYSKNVELPGLKLAFMRQIRDRLAELLANFTIPSQLIVDFVHDLARGPFARRRV